MGFPKSRRVFSLPDLKKLQKTMETVFTKRISYGTFLAEKGFMTKKLRLYMLRKHLERVNGNSKTINF